MFGHVKRNSRSKKVRRRVGRFEALEARQLLAGDITSNLVAHWGFQNASGNNVPDSAPADAVADNGTLRGNASINRNVGFNGGALSLDGSSDYVSVNASGDLNSTAQKRTVGVSFYTNESSNRRQVIYEEGGGDRGLIVYVQGGNLRMGAWNIPESGWQGTFISKPVNTGQWYHATLVINGTSSIQNNVVVGYLNGSEFGRGRGSHLRAHGDPAGIGGANGLTRYQAGTTDVSGANSFKGFIDEVKVFNRALTATDVSMLAQGGSAGATGGSANSGGGGNTSSSSLVGHWTFNGASNGSVADIAAGDAVADNAALRGNARINNSAGFGGALQLDGSADYAAVNASNDLTNRTVNKRTVSLWFYANENGNRRQVLFEEGGGSRGLSIYLQGGRLNVGGWNIPESGWQGTWLSKSVGTRQWHHVSLVLNGSASVQNNALIAYHNGQEFGRGRGSQVWAHGDPIGLGAANAVTRYQSGSTGDSGANSLNGYLDEVRVYNRVLSASEVAGLAQGSPAAPTGGGGNTGGGNTGGGNTGGGNTGGGNTGGGNTGGGNTGGGNTGGGNTGGGGGNAGGGGPVTLPSGAVRITPGQNINSIANSRPQGQAFIIAAGVHRRQSVHPRFGQTFVGEEGAILDGQNSTAYAFWGGSNNVTLRNIEVRNYSTQDYHAAIEIEEPAAQHINGVNWVLDDVYVHSNRSHGINMGDNTRITNSRVNSNGLVGIGGRRFSGGLIEGNTVHGNNTRNAYPNSHGGGIKHVKASGLVIRNNVVTNNTMAGIWCDEACTNWTVTGNTVTGHYGIPGSGIQYEISTGALIQNNVVRNGGRPQTAWAWGAGLQIATSRDVTAIGNTVSNFDTPIGIVQQNRNPPIVVTNVHIRNNTVWDSGRNPNLVNGVVTDTGDNSIFNRNFTFQNNRYRGARSPLFFWNGRQLSLSQWQALGKTSGETYQR